MERLVELLARVLISKGVEYAIAYMVAREQAAALGGSEEASGMGGCSCRDPLAECRMRSRLDLEDDCYAWDIPRGRRH